MTSKKIAPEPPRRHCSMRNTRTLSQDSGQITAAVGLNSNLFYGGSGIGALMGTGGGGGSLQQHQQHQQHAVSGNSYLNHHLHGHATGHAPHHQQQQQQQPIYANYATIQQTTAEIHCEKFHDNKVKHYNYNYKATSHIQS